MDQISHFLHLFIWLLVFILFVILIFTSMEFVILVARSIINRLSIFNFSQPVDTSKLFLIHVQGLIGGVLLLTIIIELIQTLLTSLKKDKNTIYLLILFEIAIIAVIRHLFIYELDHMNGLTIIGIAFLILVLGLMNLLYRNPDFISNYKKKGSKTKNN